DLFGLLARKSRCCWCEQGGQMTQAEQRRDTEPVEETSAEREHVKSCDSNENGNKAPMDDIRLFSGNGPNEVNRSPSMPSTVEESGPAAAEQLLVLVYDELRRLAATKLLPGETIQPTSLVHEVWLRLVGDQTRSFKDRKHFFRACAET